MAYPNTYARKFGFQQYQDSHPDTPAPGDEHDSEFDDIASTSSEIVDFLKTSIRSDGKLANGSVGIDQLAKDLAIGFHEPTTYTAGAAYSVNDTVFYLDAFYQCRFAHVATDTFNTDYWTLLVNFNAQMNSAAASAAAAAGSEANAAASASAASTSETNAANSASSASTSATNAASSANAASTSATNAASSESAASTSATSAANNATILTGAAQRSLIMPRTISIGSSDSLQELSSIPSTVQIIETRGYYAPGDGGGAQYVRRGSLPANPGFFHVDGVYWEICDLITYPEQFGAKGDGMTADGAALQNMLTGAAARGSYANIRPKSYVLGAVTLFPPSGCNVNGQLGATLIVNTSGQPAVSFAGAIAGFGNNCVWNGCVITSTVVDGTSATSVNLSTLTGALTIAASAGMANMPIGGFCRVYSTANPANAFDGVVSAYNSGTGSLTFSTTFPQGTGTHTDWKVQASSGSIGVIINAVSNTRISGLTVSGNFYIGMQLSSWNASGTTPAALNCVISDCVVNAAQNRAFYTFGTVNNCTWRNCYANGLSVTNYAFNMNPGNSGSSVNAIQNVKFEGCTADSPVFQGFAWSENTYKCNAVNCTVTGARNQLGNGVAFLWQTANTGGIPQYNNAVGCVAQNCDVGFEFLGAFYDKAVGCQTISCTTGYTIKTSGSVNSAHISLIGCDALSCTANGFTIGANSGHALLYGINSVGNTLIGVEIDSGSDHAYVTGRSFANGTNLADSGTSSNTAALITA